MWHPIRGCQFCLQFTDTSYIVSPGVYAALRIQLTSNPADGNTCDFSGQTFTYRTVPTGSFDIAIGAAVPDTVANTLAAFSRLRKTGLADFDYVQAASVLTITARRVGVEYSILSFSAGTSPWSILSQTAGEDPEYLAGTRELLQVSAQVTSNPIEKIQFPELASQPQVTLDTYTGEPSATIEFPVADLLMDVVNDPVPTIPASAFASLVYGAMPILTFRYGTYTDAGGFSPFTQSIDYYALPANCPAPDEDFALYSQRRVSSSGQIKWLTRRATLEFDPQSPAYLHAAVKGGINYTVSVTRTPAGGIPVVTLYPFTPARDCVVRLSFEVDAMNSNGTVEVSMSGTGATSHAYETIILRRAGCAAGTVLFRNRFGQWETLDLVSLPMTSISGEADRLREADGCDNSGRGDVDYRTTRQIQIRAVTQKLRPSHPDDLALLEDVYSSPDHYLLVEGGWMHVTLDDRGEDIRPNNNSNAINYTLDFNYKEEER